MVKPLPSLENDKFHIIYYTVSTYLKNDSRVFQGSRFFMEILNLVIFLYLAKETKPLSNTFKYIPSKQTSFFPINYNN